MATIATLNVSLKATTKKFRKGLRSASKAVDKFAKNVVSSGVGLVKYGGVLAGVAAGALTFYIKKTLDAIDETAKFADRIGVGTEALKGLELAGKLTGVPINQLRLGLQRMTRRISEAAKGLGEAQGALKELGLDAKELNALSVDEQFRTLAGAMQQVQGQSDRVRLAFKLFDSEGVALVNTLALGAEGINNVQRQAVAMGFAFNRIDAAKVEAANNSLVFLGAKIEGVVNRLTVGLAGAISKVSGKISDLIPEGKELDRVVSRMLDGMASALGKVVNASKVVIAALKAIQGAALLAVGGVTRIVQDLLERAELIGNFIKDPTGTGKGGTVTLGARQTKAFADQLFKDSNKALDEALKNFKQGIDGNVGIKFSERVRDALGGFSDTIKETFENAKKQKEFLDVTPDRKVGQFREIDLKNIQVGGLRVLQDPQVKEQKKSNELLAQIALNTRNNQGVVAQ